MSPRPMIVVEVKVKRAIISNPEKNKKEDSDSTREQRDKKGGIQNGVPSKLFTFEI